MADFIKELNLDMGTLKGRLRYADFVLGTLEMAKRKELPIQPDVLGSYTSKDVGYSMRREKQDNEDRRIIKAYHKWRDEILKLEGINRLNLQAQLRAIQIYDEAWDSGSDKEKADIDVKRETIGFFLKDQYDLEGEELDQALLDPFNFARKKAADFLAFDYYWRDPLRRYKD